MANKTKVKLILELKEAHMSQRSIAATRHMSKSSVSDVFRIANEKSFCYSDIRDMSDDEVCHLFYPAKHADLGQMHHLPDYTCVHAGLKRAGATLKLLWQEYSAECRNKGTMPVGYSKHCDDYSKYVQSMALTNHLAHKPGARCEVDWSGPAMTYVDIDTGEVVKVYLFVATLPYSQYSCVEPCLDMKQDTWLRCHIHMYRFFGGVPVRTVCDNLKTGCCHKGNGCLASRHIL